RSFVPDDLPNTEVNGEGGLTLTAFTLVAGATGPEFYAAVRNDGETPACEAGMRIDFFDEAGGLVTTAASALLSGRLYRIDDGSGTVITCVPPGEVAMTASTDLPESMVIDELGRLEHQFPAFQLDVVPIEGLTVSDVQPHTATGGTAFTGTVTNGLDVAASNPKVSVFPLNRVGRPLGVATSSAVLDVAPAGTWPFETTTVGEPGVDAAAYPTASITP
ncbi:MAG TPA: FxLYD domain-containing protein, partial [Polyangiaceae bacterium]